jgi:nucleoside-diphosphate-sugar epimerase
VRILITGAGGFIGGHAAKRFVARGHEVIATARTPAAVAEPANHRLFACDLSLDSLDSLMRDCEVIVHCAARASPWGPRESFWRDNVLATERLLAAAHRAGSVRRFVHVSTPSIYFNGRDQLNRVEDFDPPARWPTAYAETKWEAECRVRAAPALGGVILRPRAVFGPGDRAIVPRLVAVAERGVMPLPGGGSALTDITYVDNVVDAIEAAVHAPATAVGRAFNITNGEPLTVRDLLMRLFGALGIRARLVTMPRSLANLAARISESAAMLRPGRPEPRLTRYGVGLLAYSQTLCIDAARRELGFAPVVSVDEGLARYARSRSAR